MLIDDLANNKADALAKIPGVTPKIIGASVTALKEAYLESFKSVGIAVCCFCAVGVIGKISHRVLNENPLADTGQQGHSSSSILPKISITRLMLLPSRRRICMARQIIVYVVRVREIREKFCRVRVDSRDEERTRDAGESHVYFILKAVKKRFAARHQKQCARVWSLHISKRHRRTITCIVAIQSVAVEGKACHNA